METARAAIAPDRRAEDDIDLLRYGRFLASYWAVLLAGVACGALVLLAVAASLPVKYQSTVTLALTPRGDPSPVSLTPASAKAMLANVGLVTETIKESGLDRDGVTPQTFIDDAVDISPVPSTNLFRISVTLTDADKARAVASMLATKMVELSRRLDLDGASTARQDVEERLPDAQAAAKKAEQALLDYQIQADVEGLEAELQNLQRQRRPTDSQRAEIYRRRLEIERLHATYLERWRLHRDLAARYEDAGKARAPQAQIVDPPVRAEYPQPRRLAQFGTFGAVLGLVTGIVAALLLNRRRTPPAHS